MSTSTASFDASVALDRKLTQEETRELKILLMPYFHATGDSDTSPEDINDLLDYAFAMVNNQKTVEYVIKELVGMEMEFCNSTIAEKVGSELSGFLQKVLKVEGKLTSIKSTSSKDNALTMSGALGSSREGGRNNKSGNNRDGKGDGKGSKNNERRRDDRRGDRGRGNNRGGRSTHKEAFDRLSNNSGNRRGKDNDRGDRRRRDDDRWDERGGRGGRRGRDGRRDGGRGGRSGGRGDRGDRNDRSSGNRRTRDEYENEDFMSMRDEGRGRGRGRGRGKGRGGPEGTAKRQRYDDYYDEGYGDDGYYDDGYGYGGHHGYGGRGRYGFPGRGRGRGRFGGRGRGGRGRGRGRGEESNEAGNGDVAADTNAKTGEVEEGGSSDTANHPSPLVQASYSGGRGGYGGRGRFGRGRGRGRGGGRAHVVSMIQSKTWVRKKPVDAAANAEAEPAE